MVDNNWKHNWSPLSDECETCGKSGLRVRQEMRSMGQSECRHEPAEQKAFYGTQPAVLPKTLPPGVLTLKKNGRQAWRSSSASFLNGHIYDGDWGTDGTDPYATGFYPASIDWTTVPIQEDSPPARAGSVDAATREDAGEESGAMSPEYGRQTDKPLSKSTQPAEPVRADPYAEPDCDRCESARTGKAFRSTGDPKRVQCLGCDKEMPRIYSEEHIYAEMVARNERRLSAMSRADRRKSEALRMMDRPIAGPKHPVMWPEGSEYKEQV